MFKSLDVLIGLSVVMLILSLAVTVITQFIGTQLLNLRGKALKTGLVRLLGLLDDKTLTQADSERIVDYVLRHSLVSSSGRLAGTIHREEFTKLVIDFAVHGDGAKADSTQKAATAATVLAKVPGMGAALPDDAADADVRTRLLAVLQKNGIPDPVAALQAVRATALALETTVPELSSNVRQTMALVQHASGDYLAKINAWFDQTVDRATDVYNGRSHWVTAGVGAIVAIALHINTLDILNRLSSDSKVRDSLVALAVDHPERFAHDIAEVDKKAAEANAGDPKTADATAAVADAPAPDAAVPAAADSADASGEAAASPSATKVSAPQNTAELYNKLTRSENFVALTDANLVSLPSGWNDYKAYWRGPAGEVETTAGGLTGRIAGVILTVALLSLGAPLWYQLLGNLTNLRSLTTRRDDQQRTERQTTQTASLPVRDVAVSKANQASDPGA